MRVRSVFSKRLLALGSGAAVAALAVGGIAYAAAPSASAGAARSPGSASALVASAAGHAKRTCGLRGSAPSAGTPKTVSVAAGTAISAAKTRTAGRCRRPGRLVRLARRAVHAELIVRTRDGYRTIDIDRGTFKSDASGTITIVRPDGPTVSASLTKSTRYPGLTQSQLKPGDRVVLVQSGGNALAVRARGSKGGR
jgi:hypothetical protein